MTGMSLGSLRGLSRRLAVAMPALLLPGAALAQRLGKAQDGQFSMLEPASPIMEQVTDLHNLLLIVSAAICILVGGLLLWVMIRYNRRRNPEPSRTSHNTPLEVAWTTIPVLILVLIAVPSFRLLYAQDRTPEADVVVKVTGHQWYWTYEYPDEDGLRFDAFMLPSEYFTDPAPQVQERKREALADLAEFLGRDDPPEIFRLLDTDTRMVVPVDSVVKVLVTASDVLHSWTVPAFGIKIDSVPGRLNETWFKATEAGTYYGQCSELCGIRHAFMPIVVEVVSKAEYQAWLTRAREQYADAGAAEARSASAD